MSHMPESPRNFLAVQSMFDSNAEVEVDPSSDPEYSISLPLDFAQSSFHYPYAGTLNPLEAVLTNSELNTSYGYTHSLDFPTTTDTWAGISYSQAIQTLPRTQDRPYATPEANEEIVSINKYHVDSSHGNDISPTKATETLSSQKQSKPRSQQDKHSAAPGSKIAKAGNKRSNREKKPKSGGKDKTPYPEFTKPLSMAETHVPICDPKAFVHRSREKRLKNSSAKSKTSSTKVKNSGAKGENSSIEEEEKKWKRPCNSFIVYRHTFKERAKAWLDSKDNQKISALAGQSWKMETNEVRDQFVRLAGTDKIVHEVCIPYYKFAPGTGQVGQKRKSAPVDGDGTQDEHNAKAKSKRKRNKKCNLEASPAASEPSSNGKVDTAPRPECTELAPLVSLAYREVEPFQTKVVLEPIVQEQQIQNENLYTVPYCYPLDEAQISSSMSSPPELGMNEQTPSSGDSFEVNHTLPGYLCGPVTPTDDTSPNYSIVDPQLLNLGNDESLFRDEYIEHIGEHDNNLLEEFTQKSDSYERAAENQLLCL